MNNKANGKKFGIGLILLAVAMVIGFSVDIWRGSPPNAAVCVLIVLVFLALVGVGLAFYRGIFLFSTNVQKPNDELENSEKK